MKAKSPKKILQSFMVLARCICSIAQTAGMPDTYWETDRRMALAKKILGEKEFNRWKTGKRTKVYGGKKP